MMQKLLYSTLIALCCAGAASAQQPVQEPGKELCSLLVSFYSRGSGTNYRAADSLKSLLASCERDTRRIRIDTIRWGREGERDLCFHLGQLSSRKKKRFVRKVKATIGSSENVRIEENKASMHRR
jgi:hypothetical protein